MDISSSKVIFLCSSGVNKFALFERFKNSKKELFIAESIDGINFKAKPKIRIGTLLISEKIEELRNIILSASECGYFLTYKKKSSKQDVVYAAFSTDGIKFTYKACPELTENGYILHECEYSREDLMLLGGKHITLTINDKSFGYENTNALLLSPREGFFDSGPLFVLNATVRKSGILLIYYSVFKNGENKNIKVGAALLDKENPFHVIWRSDIPIYEKNCNGSSNSLDCDLVGSSSDEETISLYFYNEKEGLSFIKVPCVIHIKVRGRSVLPSTLLRHPRNPILCPSENEWEKEAVFNPAVITKNGKFHMFYRAMGPEGISRLGYAKSKNGFDWTMREEKPIFELKINSLNENYNKTLGEMKYDIITHPSGGGWRGCEDPRAVFIDNRVYVTYVDFEGWNSVRMAVTSIDINDLEKKSFKWRRPVFISPKEEVNKNWVLFPEKINGKFAVLHSISPEILIDYIDDLDNFDKDNLAIQSRPPQGGRKEFWDSKVRGAGPPPLKTKDGWLLLYHATDARNPFQYKLGAMLLDLKDPTKILFRSKEPILTPDMPYENDGKPGVVYASGAVIKNGNLIVYYGGGDKVVCAASHKLDTFIKKLMNQDKIALVPTEAVLV